MASPPKPLKSILKKPKSPAPSAASLALATADDPAHAEDDARQIAVQHASILQQRKDLETQVFDAINELLDFPLARTAPQYRAAHPAPGDATRFRALVRAFQPADYDDLVEERNIAGLCGYALCANPRRRFPRAGEFKLTGVGTRDFRIVRTADLEKWCSDGCARRALYVRIQLGETAAWERAGRPDFKIDLLSDDERSDGVDETGLARDVTMLQLDDPQKKAQEASVLALERGDVSTALPTPGRFVDIAIREKKTIRPPTEPSLAASQDGGDLEDSHLIVEGHKVRHGNG